MDEMISIALKEPCQIGETVPFVGKRYVVVKEITRAEFWHDTVKRRKQDADAGKPRARRGYYNTETKEFQPTDDAPPGEEYKYFYFVVESA
jgi:hypothetical protein